VQGIRFGFSLGSLVLFVFVGFALSVEASENPTRASAQWTVKSLKKSAVNGLIEPSPDGKLYLVNKEDEKGVVQVYVGKTGSSTLTCITCTQETGGPKPERLKMQPHWHPSSKWIIMAVERDEYSKPPILGDNKDFVEGMLQCGLGTNIYAVTPDGKRWSRLSDFKSGQYNYPDGFTGVAMTRDGKKGVYSQIVDGNIFAYYPFGRWEVIEVDITEKDGMPVFSNHKNITPKGMHWNEPGNFHPDNESLLLTGSTEKDAQGMDQYILNIKTGALTNLTNSPTVWDEHGVFSPDGEKIIFMSAWPYRDKPETSKVLGIKTEFMLMNKDGSGLTQLTRFRTEGSPEYHQGTAACAGFHADGKSALLTTLVFPNYEFWEMEFNVPEKQKRRR
jgi:Tol biopolymer transport system component